MRPARPLAFLALAATFAFPSAARAVDPEEVGEITAEIEDRQRAVRTTYGNRAAREMEPEERRELQKALDRARDEILEKHPTTARDYDVSRAKQSREDRTRSEAARQGWFDKKKKAEDGAQQAETTRLEKEPEVRVQRGFDDKNPVILDESPAPERETAPEE